MPSPPYVLVVDDEEAVRKMLTRWLVAWGYDVMAVTTADEAIGVMTTLPAPIVITDIIMPIHDGVWLLEQIRSRWPNTFVIMESGATQQDVIVRARKLGACEFLPKPFGREMLFQALQRAATGLAAASPSDRIPERGAA